MNNEWENFEDGKKPSKNMDKGQEAETPLNKSDGFGDDFFADFSSLKPDSDWEKGFESNDIFGTDDFFGTQEVKKEKPPKPTKKLAIPSFKPFKKQDKTPLNKEEEVLPQKNEVSTLLAFGSEMQTSKELSKQHLQDFENILDKKAQKENKSNDSYRIIGDAQEEFLDKRSIDRDFPKSDKLAEGALIVIHQHGEQQREEKGRYGESNTQGAIDIIGERIKESLPKDEQKEGGGNKFLMVVGSCHGGTAKPPLPEEQMDFVAYSSRKYPTSFAFGTENLKDYKS
ncbi:MAG: hypothetical protein PQ612_07890 [Rickettsiales bacterium]|nr:hypothetical protein [Pseudomonadota bacterium]MDA0967008.1 hypothetical protein [Pseudomonadota bacterium]MDG4543928.1 hypothetical protein [Rickettsiales bacterium]MDG4546074.1 hypothetical protein [Rickettsiales bacterium]MDG4548320.1 hypothetical protein [Rickettsiales bacterium]